VDRQAHREAWLNEDVQDIAQRLPIREEPNSLLSSWDVAEMMGRASGFPNVVIGGVPKAGTSSLFRWLEDHPQVCASPIKETFYLVDPGHPLERSAAHFHRDGLDGYARFFEHFDRSRHRVRLEGTTHYLYQETALEVLASLEPQPHVIFLLRKPSRRIYSSFQYSQQTLATLSSRLSFREYVETIRRGGTAFEENAVMRKYAPIWRNEIRYSRYAEYLRKWRALFGPDRIHVLLFEDLVANPRGALRMLCRNLELDEGFYAEYGFPRYNETYRVKSVGLQRVARRVGAALPYGAVRAAIRGQYLRFFSDRAKRAVTAEERAVLQQLDAEFEPYNRALEEEFELDLRAWRGGAPAGAPAA
jgi:hypothetical protein